MTADLSRYDDVLAWLRRRGETDEDVRAVFVGGSAVTGGYDDHSDVDVEVLVTPGEAVAAYERLLADAERALGVDHVWHVPANAWPDGRQGFLHLQPDPGRLDRPTRIIDLHVSDLADHHRQVDVRRHGTPYVVHDPDGLVELVPDDEDRLAAERAEQLEQISTRRQTARWLVNRAIARGDVAEATMFHLQFAVVPLVRLLRIKHTPARHDFGLRYLRADLPGEVCDRLEPLLPGPDLQARADAAFAWQDELAAELDA